MKKALSALLTLGILFSCNNEDDSNPNSELIGNWKLIEVRIDPGYRSTFVSVESDKIITFKNDGTITSNGNLCSESISTGNPTSGTYSTLEMTFTSDNCDYAGYDFPFEKNGNTLIIIYPCREACWAKYIKE